jgi:hypothetical protein
MEDPVYIDVNSCARCSYSHRSVEFRKFKKNGVRDLTHWGMCPKTKEPILLKVISNG